MNENIKEKKVFIICPNKETKIVTRTKALKMAEEQKSDLYVISYNNDKIPICKIGDFLKYKYLKIKQHKIKTKKIIAQNVVKRITMRANIDNNDLQIKANKINRFLANNQKVKISLLLFGRQIANQEVFLQSFYKLISMLKNCENKEKALHSIEQKKNLFEVVALPTKRRL